MEKKYELIKKGFNWPRVKALKDFTLITGEQIKKGDIGGFVRSEDCLSHEGLCWIKDESEVWGKVSGNAVIKDYAKVYGDVCGNAIVKDFAGVRENATVTGNAVVQAHQYIIYGTVTTDLLGTKDWVGALYAVFGIRPKDGKVTLYKAVWSTDNPNVFQSNHNRKFLYEIGKEAIETDVDENIMEPWGKGLHFTSLDFINEWGGDTILECEIDVEDILTIQYSIIRAKKCKVIRVIRRKR